MKQRIITGVIAGAGFLALLIAGGSAYIVLLLALALVGYWEFVRMNGLRWSHPAALVGFLSVAAIVWPWQINVFVTLQTSELLWLVMLLLLTITVLTKNRTTIDHAANLLLGVVYIGFGFSAMLDVRLMEGNGLLATFLAFACIWSSDIGAYFFGKALGRNKLWPAISPNKTVEGALGGVMLSLAVGLLFALFAPDLVSIGQALAIGAVSACAGQMGDLIQSAYKRVRGIKDTGSILPGHGGVLDRCDSWLIVYPILVFSGLLS
ncbi:phosphatidate cytidylyltransferase [Paenibacillus sp. SYP-B4298]|uniref:phosphatidate cytidylyltransferase n=1 Tax=Paenibacillus sp. SYP-B4298 TaxID=2996034 RepID=UPI0022DE0F3E|nr:phosphatidate cytidylyltransferase [Paenibacillus sp. SYP-B4298]